MSAALLVVSLVLWWYLGYLNKKKHEVQFSEHIAELREKSLEDLGEYHPGMFHPSPARPGYHHLLTLSGRFFPHHLSYLGSLPIFNIFLHSMRTGEAQLRVAISSAYDARGLRFMG